MKKAWINKKYITGLACKWTVMLFSLLGFVGTFVSLNDIIPNNWKFRYKMLFSIIIIIIIFLIFWILCAFWFERQKWIEVFEGNNGCHIYVQYGDIFSPNEVRSPNQRRNVIIPVNRCFDTIIDDDLVSSRTLHGIAFRKLYSSGKYNEDSLNTALYTDLNIRQRLVPEDISNNEKRRGNLKRYSLGTVAEIVVKVCIYDQYNYRYLKSECPAFGKKFQATEQQAETYQVDKLLINNVDYTDSFEMNITPEHSRGQLEYYVQSKKSIPMGSEYPIEIHYKSSYISPILDFFQVYGLPFPCKNFYVELYLEDGLEKEYSIITSTNSSFSKEISDSFKANEMKNFGECRIQFPEWSLAGTGYVATIKRKTQANH